MTKAPLQELCCQFWLCPDCGLPDRTEPNQVAHYGAACIDPGHRSAEPVEVVFVNVAADPSMPLKYALRVERHGDDQTPAGLA